MLVGLVTPYRARTIGAVVALLAFTLVALLPPLLAKLAVDQGIKAGDLQRLVWIVVAFVVVGLATFGLSSVQTYLTGWVGERALADLRIRLFEHLQRLSLGYFERNRTGAIISRITNDVEALDTLITDGVTSLVQNVMLLLGTAVVLFILDWRLALATLSVIPLMALATAWFRIRSNRAYRRVRERIGLVTATLAEDIAGMRVVQSYAREPRNQSNFRGINTLYRDANYETIVLNGLYFPAVDFLASLATAIVLGYGGYLLVNDQVTVGTLLAFFLYLANFFDPVQQLSQLYNTFLSATAALDKIIEVLDEEPEIVDGPAAIALPRIDGHVRFEDVRFGYGSLAEVLHPRRSLRVRPRPRPGAATLGARRQARAAARRFRRRAGSGVRSSSWRPILPGGCRAWKCVAAQPSIGHSPDSRRGTSALTIRQVAPHRRCGPSCRYSNSTGRSDPRKRSVARPRRSSRARSATATSSTSLTSSGCGRHTAGRITPRNGWMRKPVEEVVMTGSSARTRTEAGSSPISSSASRSAASA
jgi:ATP-binding cassette subfamily B protein